MKLVFILATLVVVASAAADEDHHHTKDKRQILMPGYGGYGMGMGMGMGMYPGFLGAGGLYGGGLYGMYGSGLYGGYGGMIGRKRRSTDDASTVTAEDKAANEDVKEKRQIMMPGALGLGGFGGYGMYPGLYGGGLYGGGLYGGMYGGGLYGGYPGFFGRKRREAKEETKTDREKRQLVAGGYYPGALGGGYPMVGAPVVGGYGLGVGGYGLGLGLGAPVVDTGYGLPTAVVGRKRREVAASEEDVKKDKRQVMLPGALGLGYGGLGYGGLGYGYPGLLGGLYGGGLYGPGLYGGGLYGGYPGAIF